MPVDYCNRNSERSSFPVASVTDGGLSLGHTGSAVATRHMEKMGKEYPWVNNAVLPKTAPDLNNAVQFDSQKDAADGGVSLGISCHCMDLLHLAWPRLRYHLSPVVLKKPPLRRPESFLPLHFDIVRM